jgi:outer membrane protein assembly factor BamB
MTGVMPVHSRGADWLTANADPQRSAWQKDESVINAANAEKIKLLWKVELGNQPRELHSLLSTLVVGKVATPRGVRQIAIEAGSLDNVYGIDVEKGEVIWKKHFEYSAGHTPGSGKALCPGGMTAFPVIGPGGNPGKYTLYAVSWDGMLHQLNVGDGEDVEPPAAFVPPNGKPYGLNLFKGVIWTATAQRCGGNPNLLYAYDLATKKVGTFNPGSGGMWARSGPAVGYDGTAYEGTGDGRWDPPNKYFGSGVIGVRQDPVTKELKLADYYGPPNAEWLYKKDLDLNVTPVIFNYKKRELLVSSSKECRLFMLDTSQLGGNDHRTPLDRTPLICNENVNYSDEGVWGSLASWEDSKKTRWILTPFWGPQHPAYKYPVSHGPVVNGAIAAFKVEDRAGQPKLSPAWVSLDMDQPEPPVIANGLVFAYANGEDSRQFTPELGLAAIETAVRIKGSTHAVLYVLDAQTGRKLYSSADQINSFVHFGSLAVANGRVYIGTWDGALYCFGIEAKR